MGVLKSEMRVPAKDGAEVTPVAVDVEPLPTEEVVVVVVFETKELLIAADADTEDPDRGGLRCELLSSSKRSELFLL